MVKKPKKNGKRLKVTVFLIKEEYSEIDDFLELGSQFHRLPVRTSDADGVLIFRNNVYSEPEWANLFQEVEGFNKSDIFNLTSRGLYITEYEGRFFCFTFGHARHLINQLSYERNFGLIVALNVSNPESIRSIDKTNISQVALHSKEQATKNLEIGEFEFDRDIDILKSITAQIEKNAESDGTDTVSGRDSVSICTRVHLGSFYRVAKDLYSAFNNKRYKTLYPWFEFIQEERDKVVINSLDALLVERIIKKNFHDVWMAIPEVVEWADIRGFANKKNDRRPLTRLDLDIERWSKECNINESLTIESLKRMNVFMYWSDDRPPKRWKVYRCLNAEIDLDGKKYILSDGAWYHINRDYVTEVNKFYNAIPDSQLSLPPFGSKKEPEYLKEVEKNNNNFALMDRKLIPYGGGRSKVEFCDLLSNNGDIIHVKKYSGSSVLSHLFQQALVSGDSFLHEEEFRKKVNKKLPEKFKLENTEGKPSTIDYRICLAIMSEKPGSLELPFFSKVSLKYTVKQLRKFGFEVSKLKIDRG